MNNNDWQFKIAVALVIAFFIGLCLFLVLSAMNKTADGVGLVGTIHSRTMNRPHMWQ